MGPQELRTACTPDVKNEDVDFLVQDVTTILLEALRPSSIIQVTRVSHLALLFPIVFYSQLRKVFA